jgi:hypothetical protein
MPTFEEAEVGTPLRVAEAAMCAWEYLIEDRGKHRADQNPNLRPFWDFLESVGTSQARWLILTEVAPKIEADYQEATARGYDDPFDWEYVPLWLSKNLTEEFLTPA